MSSRSARSRPLSVRPLHWAIAFGTVLTVGVACGGGGGAAEGSSYDSLAAMAERIADGGLGCDLENVSTGAGEDTCTIEDQEAELALFDDPDDVDAAIEHEQREMSDGQGLCLLGSEFDRTRYMARGENWTVVIVPDSVVGVLANTEAVADALDGEVLTFQCGSP